LGNPQAWGDKRHIQWTVPKYTVSVNSQGGLKMRFGRQTAQSFLIAFLLLANAALARDKDNPDHSATCIKSIAVARATAGKTEPFLPDFVVNWWRKNSKHYPDICLSQSPSGAARNYLIIGSTSESSLEGLFPTVRTYTNTSTSPYTSYGTVSDQYGNVWNYTATGEVTTTTTTTVPENLPYTDRFVGLYMNAYDSNGRMILATRHIYTSRTGGDAANTAGYNLGSALTNINARGRMLKSLFNSIRAD
jgi:hypothetical protein